MNFCNYEGALVANLSLRDYFVKEKSEPYFGIIFLRDFKRLPLVSVSLLPADAIPFYDINLNSTLAYTSWEQINIAWGNCPVKKDTFLKVFVRVDLDQVELQFYFEPYPFISPPKVFKFPQGFFHAFLSIIGEGLFDEKGISTISIMNSRRFDAHMQERFNVQMNNLQLSDDNKNAAASSEEKPKSEGITANVAMEIPNSEGISANVAMEIPKSEGFTANLAMDKPKSKGFTANLAMDKPKSKGFTGNLAMEKPKSKGFTGNQAMEKPKSKGFTGNLAMEKPKSKGSTGNPAIEKPKSKGFTANLAIEKPPTVKAKFSAAVPESELHRTSNVASAPMPSSSNKNQGSGSMSVASASNVNIRPNRYINRRRPRVWRPPRGFEPRMYAPRVCEPMLFMPKRTELKKVEFEKVKPDKELPKNEDLKREESQEEEMKKAQIQKVRSKVEILYTDEEETEESEEEISTNVEDKKSDRPDQSDEEDC